MGAQRAPSTPPMALYSACPPAGSLSARDREHAPAPPPHAREKIHSSDEQSSDTSCRRVPSPRRTRPRHQSKGVSAASTSYPCFSALSIGDAATSRDGNEPHAISPQTLQHCRTRTGRPELEQPRRYALDDRPRRLVQVRGRAEVRGGRVCCREARS